MSYLIVFSFHFILLIMLMVLNFSKNKHFFNKSDSFECGFNSMSNPNTPFNMPFFYVSLMFLIFDLELALLIFFPLLNKESFNLTLNTLGTLFLVLFLTLYEWEKNIINWF